MVLVFVASNSHGNGTSVNNEGALLSVYIQIEIIKENIFKQITSNS